MSTKQNVLIVHNYYQFAGGEDTVVQNEMNLLREKGHRVVLYTRSNRELQELSPFRKMLLPFTAIFSLRTYRDIKHLILQEHIDVVHVHNTFLLISFSVYYAAKHCGCKLFQTIHNFRLLCPNGMLYREHHICSDCISKGLYCSVKHRCYRDSKLQSCVVAFCLLLHRKLGTFRLPDAYLPLTEHNKKLLESVIPAESMVVKPNFLPTFPELPISDSDRNGEYYLFLSRLEEIKGIFLVLEAFRLLPSLPLLIIGSGPEEDSVRQYIESNKMLNVRLLGQQPHDKVLDYIRGSKALLFASQWYEGFPMTIVETLACRKPVIAGNTPNITSVIQDGYNGFTFSYDSSAALQEAVNRFETQSANPEILRILAKNAGCTFQEHFTAEKTYEILMNLYS